MSPPDQARGLMTLACKDLKAAKILAEAQEPEMEAAGFHLQQAVEKALKAWLILKQVAYPRTHDLSLLLGMLEDTEESVESFWPLLVLNSFAVQFRYELPGEVFPEYASSVRLVDELLQHIQSFVD